MQAEDRKMLERLAENPNFQLMITAEIPVKYPEILSIHNHIKLLIVDERYYVVGGTNLDDNLCSEGTKPVEGPIAHPEIAAGGRDEDVVGRGEMAAELRTLYFKLYAVWEHYNNTYQHIRDPEHFRDNNRYFPLLLKKLTWLESFESFLRLVEVEEMEAVFGGSMQSSNAISLAYTKLIDNAEEEIILGHLYFNPIDSISDALLAAVNRDLSLTIITNGDHDNVTPEYNKFFVWGSRLNYASLFYGEHFNHTTDRWSSLSKEPKKTEVYEYFVPQILYHKKTMVLDKKTLVIGSYNFGLKSDMGDYELILIIHSPEIAKQALQVYEVDKKFSTQITPAQACKWYFSPSTSYIGALQRQFHPLI